MAKNCPRDIEEDIEKYAKLANIPIVKFEGTGLELGEFCGKPFLVNLLSPWLK